MTSFETIRLDEIEDAGGRLGELLTGAYRPRVRISGTPTEVYRPDGSLLMRYVPGAVPREDTRRALPAVIQARWDSVKARATASGVKGKRSWRKEDGTRSAYGAIHLPSIPDLYDSDSGVLGSFDRIKRAPYCRLTRFSRDFAERQAAILPVVERVAEAFRDFVPDRYAVQMEWARRTDPAWILPGTPFSTVTVNVNFQTAIHKDAGDLQEGFGCITVIRGGVYSGGETVAVGAGIAVDLRDGDVLLYDVHEPHGNLPIAGRPGGYRRVALICYYRRKIIRCGSPEEERSQAQHRRGHVGLYTAEELARETETARAVAAHFEGVPCLSA